MAATSITVRDYRKEVPGSLSDDRLVWNFPVVESINSNKKKTIWKIYVKLFAYDPRYGAHPPEEAFIPINDEYFDSKPIVGEVPIKAWINVDSGLVGGKIKKTIPTIISVGLNQGKISATNVFTQALRDAYGKYNKQAKKANAGVVETANQPGKTLVTEKFPPMLAQILKDQKVKPKIDEEHPLYVQRKYNGVRTVTTVDCILVDDVQTYVPIMYSRRKNVYPGFGYIKAELLPALEMYWEEGRRLYFDGEIYKHGAMLQDISGHARKEDVKTAESAETIKYDYMIYDCFVANELELTYQQRKQLLEEIFAEFEFKYAKEVETFEVYTWDEVDELYKSFLAEGFEGAMVRTNDKYHFSYNERHSKVLLKIKPTLDAEFECIGFSSEGKGKSAGALMIVCKTKDGKEFNVTPAMEIPDRIALAAKMYTVEANGKTHFENHWIGKPIICYFDELSQDKVPQRARTKLEIRVWD